MARGYVGSRSKSARPTLKLKRQRAASLTDLRLQKEEKKDTEQGEKEVAQRRKVKVVRRGASASGEEKEKKIKTRSSSLVRQRIQQEEEALEESDLELSEDEEETIGDREVLTKYQLLGKAVDQVLQLLEGLCLPGANTYDLCHRGDTEVLAAVGAMYSKQKDPKTGKRMAKGISYPTNISVNEVLCNHIPLSAEEGVVLKGNDVVKVHLGAYLDGYPVTAARTIIVPAGETAEPKQVTLTREVLSAYEAGRMALLVACRSLLPGTNTADITDRMAAVGVNYQTEAVEGVLSHRVKRWVPDGTDCFIQRRVSLEEPQQDVAETTVRPLQVWTVDVAFTNNGCVCQATPPEDRRDRRKRYHTTTVGEEAHIFRRVPAGGAPPSRVPFVLDLLQLVDEYLYCFPFHYQQFEKQYVLDHHFGKKLENQGQHKGNKKGHPITPLRAKLGLQMLMQQGLVEKYPILRIQKINQRRQEGEVITEKEMNDSKDVVTVRFTATVAVLEKKIIILAGAPPAALPAHVLAAHQRSQSSIEDDTHTNKVELPPSPEQLFEPSFYTKYMKINQNNVYPFDKAISDTKKEDMNLLKSKIKKRKME